jgi:hypothetical protein
MAIETFKRYEKKFRIDDDLFHQIVERISTHMDPDAYNLNGQTYKIANIYYDTDTDWLIRNSLQKPVYKEKLRLRAYGVPKMDDKVFLEIKKKYKGVVNKRRSKLILKEAYEFIKTGQMPPKQPFMNMQVVSELAYFLQVYQVHPAVYLSYDRFAFFDREDPDFRVTFDRNITTRRENLHLEAGSYGSQLLPEGQWIMEAKTRIALPMWFTDILSEFNVYSDSFSKYGTEYANYSLGADYSLGQLDRKQA